MRKGHTMQIGSYLTYRGGNPLYLMMTLVTEEYAN